MAAPTTGNVNTQALLDKMDELITATNAPSKIDIKKGSIQKKIISEQQ